MSRFVHCLAFIAIVLVVCSQSVAISTELNDVVISTCDSQASLSNILEDHDPINIRSNQDFVSQGWIGEGSISNPYVIENLNITTVDKCISISDTTAHFTIRNCFLRSTEGYRGFALYFDNVVNGAVEGCTLTSFGSWMAPSSDVVASGTGAKIVNSENCTFKSNAIEANGEGLVIEWCLNLIIGANIVSDNDFGARLSNTNHTVFEDNQFFNNWEGIWTIYLDSCVFRNQTIREKNIGMLIRYSTNLRIQENSFQYCGLRFWGVRNTDDLNHSIVGNTVNDQPLAYVYNQSDTIISGEDFGQVIIADCHNITLSEFKAGNASSAIQLISSTDCTVTNCTAFDNSRDGIYLFESRNCAVRNNTLINNLYGLRIDSSSEIDIEVNMFQFNFRAMSVYDTDVVFIKGNEVLNSTYVGIKITDHSSSIVIESNRIENSTFGIIIQYADTGIIRENVVYECSEVGIVLSNEAVNFRVYYNHIGWNTVNARDDEGVNVWDDGISRGNNWTDYCGTGVYAISGLNEDAADRYPSFLFDPSRPNVTMPPCGYAILLVIIFVSTISITVVIVVAFTLWKRKQSLAP